MQVQFGFDLLQSFKYLSFFVVKLLAKLLRPVILRLLLVPQGRELNLEMATPVSLTRVDATRGKEIRTCETYSIS